MTPPRSRPKMIYGGHKAMMEEAVAMILHRGEIDGVTVRLPGILARPKGPVGDEIGVHVRPVPCLERGRGVRLSGLRRRDDLGAVGRALCGQFRPCARRSTPRCCRRPARSPCLPSGSRWARWRRKSRASAARPPPGHLSPRCRAGGRVRRTAAASHARRRTAVLRMTAILLHWSPAPSRTIAQGDERCGSDGWTSTCWSRSTRC